MPFHDILSPRAKGRTEQEILQIGGTTVYFKEFGDPRIIDKRDGKYLAAGEAPDIEFQVNEILEFAIGTEPYGKVRWIHPGEESRQ